VAGDLALLINDGEELFAHLAGLRQRFDNCGAVNDAMAIRVRAKGISIRDRSFRVLRGRFHNLELTNPLAFRLRP
jgi:hypothetical protein